MRRRRKARLARLNNVLERLGFPIVESESLTEPFEEWAVRGRLADDTSKMMMSGWKISPSLFVILLGTEDGAIPYQRVESLLLDTPYSDNYAELKSRVENRIGNVIDDDPTPGELVCQVLQQGFDESPRLRTTTRSSNPKTGLLPTKLMQSDNANELKRNFEVQRVDESHARELLLGHF